MKQRLEGWLHRALRPFGFDLKRYNALADPNLRRQRILKRHRIEQVLDGGANRGQYAARLREDGYRGRLLSVEPGAAAFAALQRASLRDDKWQVVQAALGAAPGHATLNVTANSVSSSLLAAADAQAAVSGAHVVTTERVEVTTLDVLAARFLERSSPTLLKLDVQGSEGAALDGGAELLGRVELVEVELALAELYTGQASGAALAGRLDRAGFVLVSVAPNTLDHASGYLLEIDALFARRRDHGR